MKNNEKYRIVFSSKFKRSIKKIQKRGLKYGRLLDVIHDLALGNKLDTKYHDHALKGSSNRYRECYIQPDWLLIYKIEEDILILTLVDTGTHSDLFDK